MAAEIRTGCMGWSYKDWVGPFYPQGTSQKDYLALYSRAFDTVEVDSAFYRTPAAEVVEKWSRTTPDEFRFSVKFPGKITHDAGLAATEEEISAFESAVMGFGKKLSCILILLPPSSRFEQMFDRLQNIISMLRSGLRYAVEFRHRSWFNEEVYRLLSEKGMSLAWSVNQYADSPPVLTSDFIYLRFIGDRKLTSFGHVQKDRLASLKEWAGNVLRAREESGLRGIYAYSNNHFAGFAPETINTFRGIAGLEQLNWRMAMIDNKRGDGSGHRQKSLDELM